jgi:hypothetical protein
MLPRNSNTHLNSSHINYNKIKTKIDINNDKLMKIIWKHIREIKKNKNGANEGAIILTSFSHFQSEDSIKI